MLPDLLLLISWLSDLLYKCSWRFNELKSSLNWIWCPQWSPSRIIPNQIAVVLYYQTVRCNSFLIGVRGPEWFSIVIQNDISVILCCKIETGALASACIRSPYRLHILFTKRLRGLVYDCIGVILHNQVEITVTWIDSLRISKSFSTDQAVTHRWTLRLLKTEVSWLLRLLKTEVSLLLRLLKT